MEIAFSTNYAFDYAIDVFFLCFSEFFRKIWIIFNITALFKHFSLQKPRKTLLIYFFVALVSHKSTLFLTEPWPTRVVMANAGMRVKFVNNNSEQLFLQLRQCNSWLRPLAFHSTRWDKKFPRSGILLL